MAMSKFQADSLKEGTDSSFSGIHSGKRAFPRGYVLKRVKEEIAKLLEKPEDSADLDGSFLEMGINSLKAVELVETLNQAMGIELGVEVAFDYRGIKELSAYIDRQYGGENREDEKKTMECPSCPDSRRKAKGDIQKATEKDEYGRLSMLAESSQDIAIIGISGRFADSETVEEFWHHLREGNCCIAEIQRDGWETSKYYDPDPIRRNKSISKWGGLLKSIDRFDALFFNISPREAERMDPQQRLFLEEAYRAFEDGGYSTEQLSGKKIGVFVGGRTSDYKDKTLETEEINSQTFLGTDMAILSARISYYLNLKGPALAIDTACSSSLVAIHLACESIRRGESEMALAGGVFIMNSPEFYLMTSKTDMLSPEGSCRTFDDKANGIVVGEGVGACVLKRLDDALRDGDYIYGVVKGSVINQDGKTKGITAPSTLSQKQLIYEAYQKTNIQPETVGYIEAHGTGTKLGDPIEIKALTEAFGMFTDKRQFCAIGSHKPNIGHTIMTAGIAGVFKVLMAMKYRQIPPTINVSKINSHIDFDRSPFYINTKLQEWKSVDGSPLRAGVSSFGFSGTNCHVILEEAPPQRRKIKSLSKPYYFIPLSAKTETALRRKVVELDNWLEKEMEGCSMEDISYTLHMGRSHFNVRSALVVKDVDELRQKVKDIRKTGTAESYLTHDLKKTPSKQEPVLKELGGYLIGQINGTTVLREEEYREKLLALMDLYVKGYDFNWESFYREGDYHRIPMPAYPFDKERYWIPQPWNAEETSGSSGGGTGFAIAAGQYVMEKAWKESETHRQDVQSFTGTALVLVNNETRLIAKSLFRRMEGIKVVVIQDDSSFSRRSDDEYLIDFTSAGHGARAAREMLDRENSIAGLIDLSDLHSDSMDRSKGSLGKIALLQALIKNSNHDRFCVLHLTKGLQAFGMDKPTLAGADFAGIIRMLSAEYGRVASRTVDIDLPLSDVESIERVIFKELGDRALEGEICYREGKRYSPYLKELDLADQEKMDISIGSIAADPDSVFVITGGTRGIGAAMAEMLADKGARKLVLMGMQELPARSQWNALSKDVETTAKINLITRLENKGVHLEIYAGPLTDKAKISQFFERIRQRLGNIKGVIHCAGLSKGGNTAFINKNMEDIEAVFKPKINGLESLHEIFSKDELSFFILCSSVSAQIPVLASGITDYAAANAFMDYFASYQYRKGNTYYKSINWPGWKDVGMGAPKSPIYYQIGFTALSTADGLLMLDKSLRFGQNPCIMPCLVNTENFKPDMLLSVRQNRNHKPNRALTVKDRTPAVAMCVGGTRPSVKQWLKELFSKELKIPKDRLDEGIPFEDFGIDSILIAELIRKIEEWIGKKLDPSIFLEYPTLQLLSQYLDVDIGDAIKKNAPDNGSVGEKEKSSLPVEVAYNCEKGTYLSEGQVSPAWQKVAIIGIACNFPGANNKEDYWKNLVEGKSSIKEVPASRWDVNHYYAPEYKNGKTVSKWGGFIENIDYFDAQYFGINPEEAPHIDPLIRQFLEVSGQTLRDAGYEKGELWGKRVGVFVGSRVANYSARIKQMLKNSIMGIGQNFIAAHVSHFFNFKGPTMVVDTACSSSLVSVHLACQSLLMKESDLALAGGVDILLDEKPYIILSEGRALSPDGKCHTFDEKANGFVPGEGCGAVLLKLLDKAIADGDRIYAVIEASAVNNDGHTMGITTPNPEAQSEVIEEALRRGKINPAFISYIETHGTGTMIGDPIELKALTKVFRKVTSERQFCGVGSVKTNIGHLLSAAGIASLIKTALALRHRLIPPTLNCETPNPRFEFANSPFYPNTTVKEWEVRDGIRRSGISSFGFGGTNAHMIVCEFQPQFYEPYCEQRSALPPIRFNRKRYVTGDNEAAAGAPSFNTVDDKDEWSKNHPNTMFSLLKLKKEY